MKENAPLRVLLAEDHTIFRQGWEAELARLTWRAALFGCLAFGHLAG